MRGGLGAFMLGVGALFHLKRPEEHWGDRPRIEVLEEARADDGAGDPPGRRLPATA